MPDWRNDLDSLLTQFGDAQGIGSSARGASTANSSPAQTTDDSTSLEDGSAPWILGALTQEEAPTDGDEVTAVRREIEATIRRLSLLARTGEVEFTLRDDVIFVLQALTRPHPATWAWSGQSPNDDEHMEWHLASAAAILRFCRIVQRLTNAITDELD